MLTLHTIKEQLTGSQIAKSFIQLMMEESEDFASDYQRYTGATELLRKELGDLVTTEIEAIEQQCASDLRFSGLLGLRANLEHFKDPAADSFLNVDFEVLLQEKTARSLPAYQQAREQRSRFYALLTPEQKAIYEPVISFVSILETIGPKLAHYYGYIMGNEFLPLVVPGYHEDPVLTMRYTNMLHHFFEKDFSLCRVIQRSRAADMQ